MVLSTYFLLQYDYKFDDNQASIEPAALWNRRALGKELGRFFGDERDQLIEIVLVPEASDLDNINAIGSNLERLNERLSEWEKHYDSYAPFACVESIAQSQSFVYTIKNLDIIESEHGSAAWAFREYLRTFFIFMRAAEGLVDVRLTSPVFCFFSQRTGAKSMDVQTGNFTQQSWYAGAKGVYTAALAENTSLLQWGAQHFARLHWRAVITAAEDVSGRITRHFFRNESDVKLLDRYMSQLGYEWSFAIDTETAAYTFVLRPQGQVNWQTVDMFSAGEREIVHFLLAMFALSVRDGVVLIDEPELHLHPRWQRIFLGLFSELAPERNNQFIVATHSPVFVTPDTVNNVTRVYRDAINGSAHVALRDIQLPKKRALVRMINSQNNERVFFADKVVLVEGITDRLVIGALLEVVAAKFHNNQAVEIVEVGGKASFAGYRELLNALSTPTFVLADLDYLTVVGSPEVRSLFSGSPEKQWEALTDKKSIDARSMIQHLETAIATTDTSELEKFRDYFVARHVRLRSQFIHSRPRRNSWRHRATWAWECDDSFKGRD